MDWDKLLNLWENSPKRSEIGKKIGKNQSNLNKILREKKQIDVVLLEKLALYFNVPVSSFFEENQSLKNKQIEDLENKIKELDKELELYRKLENDKLEMIEMMKEINKGLKDKITLLEIMVESKKNYPNADSASSSKSSS